MNIRQVSAIWLGIAAIGALLLYPPHVMIPSAVEMAQLEFGAPGNPHPVQLVRYAFIFSPPSGSEGIDWSRFWFPVAVVGLATLGAILTFPTRRPVAEAVSITETHLPAA